MHWCAALAPALHESVVPPPFTATIDVNLQHSETARVMERAIKGLTRNWPWDRACVAAHRLVSMVRFGRRILLTNPEDGEQRCEGQLRGHEDMIANRRWVGRHVEARGQGFGEGASTVRTVFGDKGSSDARALLGVGTHLASSTSASSAS